MFNTFGGAESGTRTTSFYFLVCSILFTALTGAHTFVFANETASEAPRQYTFAWQFLDGGDMAPRGGTSTGAPVTLVTEPSAAWKALREPGISALERDRRAIVAMAGAYRTSFDFIETVGFTEGYTPGAPYQSWGTEYVYVVADEPRYISLQHIIVMRFQQDDGAISEPMVVKHWRQDWHYESRDQFVFAGDRTWKKKRLSRTSAKGRWRQAVYQVDDSPRYMASGSWQHRANYSSWTSDETWRPLPRREFSVRDDYDALIGSNRHTIYPTGWVQEEDNLKAVVDAAGNIEALLAREVGLARYERISDFDWSAGDAYWEQTAPFWALVREHWNQLFKAHQTLRIAEVANGNSLFMSMFLLADESTEDEFDKAAATRAIEATLADFITAE